VVVKKKTTNMNTAIAAVRGPILPRMLRNADKSSKSSKALALTCSKRTDKTDLAMHDDVSSRRTGGYAVVELWASPSLTSPEASNLESRSMHE
jgi:hypothetical protein